MSVRACYQPIVEQVGHGLLQAHADQFDGLGRDVDAGLAPVLIPLVQSGCVHRPQTIVTMADLIPNSANFRFLGWSWEPP